MILCRTWLINRIFHYFSHSIDQLQRLGFKMSNKQLQQQQNANSTAGHQQQQQQTQQKTNGGVAKSKNSANLNGSTNSFVRKQSTGKDKERERAERERIVLWLHPIQTLRFCFAEVSILLQTYGKKWAFTENNTIKQK